MPSSILVALLTHHPPTLCPFPLLFPQEGSPVGTGELNSGKASLHLSILRSK